LTFALTAIAAMHPGKRLIHVFLDNARYHHAKLVQQCIGPAGHQRNATVDTCSRAIPALQEDAAQCQGNRI
jgi:hypothetical protein